MDHTKSLKREYRLYNIVVPEFRYIRAARVVSRGRDFNTLPNRTFVPFVSVAQNVCCLSLLREITLLGSVMKIEKTCKVSELQFETQRRMQWLRVHAPNQFRLADWRRVMFSDESRFSLQRSDRRQRVYRRLGERYSDACVREVDRFGGGGP